VDYGVLADPDGYKVEVKEGARSDPFTKVVLNVLDLDDTVKYYSGEGTTVGMKLLRRRSNVNSIPKDASMCAYVVS
jgi:hypothetical protein